jgi:hypothetical protein
MLPWLLRHSGAVAVAVVVAVVTMLGSVVAALSFAPPPPQQHHHHHSILRRHCRRHSQSPGRLQRSEDARSRWSAPFWRRHESRTVVALLHSFTAEYRAGNFSNMDGILTAGRKGVSWDEWWTSSSLVAVDAVNQPPTVSLFRDESSWNGRSSRPTTSTSSSQGRNDAKQTAAKAAYAASIRKKKEQDNSSGLLNDIGVVNGATVESLSTNDNDTAVSRNNANPANVFAFVDAAAAKEEEEDTPTDYQTYPLLEPLHAVVNGAAAAAAAAAADIAPYESLDKRNPTVTTPRDLVVATPATAAITRSSSSSSSSSSSTTILLDEPEDPLPPFIPAPLLPVVAFNNSSTRSNMKDTPNQDERSDNPPELVMAKQSTMSLNGSSPQLWPNGPVGDNDNNQTDPNNDKTEMTLGTSNQTASQIVLCHNESVTTSNVLCHNESATFATYGITTNATAPPPQPWWSHRIRRDVPVPYIQGAAAVGLALGLASMPTLLELAVAASGWDKASPTQAVAAALVVPPALASYLSVTQGKVGDTVRTMGQAVYDTVTYVPSSKHNDTNSPLILQVGQSMVQFTNQTMVPVAQRAALQSALWLVRRALDTLDWQKRTARKQRATILRPASTTALPQSLQPPPRPPLAQPPLLTWTSPTRRAVVTPQDIASTAKERSNNSNRRSEASIQHGVPAAQIQGAALTGLAIGLASLAAMQEVAVGGGVGADSVDIVPNGAMALLLLPTAVAAYLSITPGTAGQVLRAFGSGVYEAATFVPSIYRRVDPQGRLVSGAVGSVVQVTTDKVIPSLQGTLQHTSTWWTKRQERERQIQRSIRAERQARALLAARLAMERQAQWRRATNQTTTTLDTVASPTTEIVLTVNPVQDAMPTETNRPLTDQENGTAPNAATSVSSVVDTLGPRTAEADDFDLTDATMTEGLARPLAKYEAMQSPKMDPILPLVLDTADVRAAVAEHSSTVESTRTETAPPPANDETLPTSSAVTIVPSVVDSLGARIAVADDFDLTDTTDVRTSVAEHSSTVDATLTKTAPPPANEETLQATDTDAIRSAVVDTSDVRAVVADHANAAAIETLPEGTGPHEMQETRPTPVPYKDDAGAFVIHHATDAETVRTRKIRAEQQARALLAARLTLENNARRQAAQTAMATVLTTSPPLHTEDTQTVVPQSTRVTADQPHPPTNGDSDNDSGPTLNHLNSASSMPSAMTSLPTKNATRAMASVASRISIPPQAPANESVHERANQFAAANAALSDTDDQLVHKRFSDDSIVSMSETTSADTDTQATIDAPFVLPPMEKLRQQSIEATKQQQIIVRQGQREAMVDTSAPKQSTLPAAAATNFGADGQFASTRSHQIRALVDTQEVRRTMSTTSLPSAETIVSPAVVQALKSRRAARSTRAATTTEASLDWTRLARRAWTIGHYCAVHRHAWCRSMAGSVDPKLDDYTPVQRAAMQWIAVSIPLFVLMEQQQEERRQEF